VFCVYVQGLLLKIFLCYQALCCVCRFSILTLRPQLFFELRLFVAIIAEMAEEKKGVDPALAGFYEAMEKTNVEKITDEMLVGLSGDSSDSESFDIESDNDDAEDRPWRPSQVVFGKSTVKKGLIEAMKGKYFHDISVVRAGGENTIPLPEADEVVVFKSFMKARQGFAFPCIRC
jgi:hypothetical protein